MVIQGLIDAIPKVFYLLTMSLLSIIDLFQLLMRKLAGLDCYYVGSDENAIAQSGDIVYDFFTGIFTGSYPILSTVFWGLVILGFILLFLSTLIAIIRSEYTTEKAENGKGKIMFNAFKSVIYFALVPIVTIVGVYLANIVLVAVDKATTPNTNNYSSLDTSKLQTVEVSTYSFGKETVTETYVTYSLFGIKDKKGLPYGTTTTTFSGTIFKASAFKANRVRITANNEWVDTPSQSTNFAQLISTDMVTSFNGLFKDETRDTDKIAAKIDVAFADNVVFATAQELDFESSDYIKNTNNLMCDPFPSQKGETQVCADKFNVQLVWYYYDLWQFNYIIGIGAAVICAAIFINIIFGLMKRIIEMIGLFLIAPPLIGLMPLDKERAFKGWREKFINRAVMAYGAIGGMNIVFVLLPELQTIKFFNIGEVDWIVDTLLILVALLAIKDFISLISGLVGDYGGEKGGSDANGIGEKVGKDVGSLAGKAVKVGAGAVGVVGRGALVAGSAVKLAGKGALTAGDSMAKHAFGNRLTNNYRDKVALEHEGEHLAASEQFADETVNNVNKRNAELDAQKAKDRASYISGNAKTKDISLLPKDFVNYSQDMTEEEYNTAMFQAGQPADYQAYLQGRGLQHEKEYNEGMKAYREYARKIEDENEAEREKAAKAFDSNKEIQNRYEHETINRDIVAGKKFDELQQNLRNSITKKDYYANNTRYGRWKNSSPEERAKTTKGIKTNLTGSFNASKSFLHTALDSTNIQFTKEFNAASKDSMKDLINTFKNQK